MNDSLVANSGDIDLRAGGDIDIYASIQPHGGDVTAFAGGDIVIGGQVEAAPNFTGPTTIDFRAGGDIQFDAISGGGGDFVSGTLEASTVFHARGRGATAREL